MNHQQIEQLVAILPKAEAHYLPMEKVEFLAMFDVALATGEITGAFALPASDGKEYVTAFVMNDQLYQSSNPKYKLANVLHAH